VGVNAHLELNEQRLNDQVRSFGRRRMASLSRRIANQARQDVPVRTGHLGRSIGEGPITFSGSRTVHGSVHATAHYAAPVHEGRGARTIRPVNKKALRFTIAGRVVFASVVHQGPTRPRPFLRNAGMRIAAQER
jgi:hypothetical protein